MNKPFAFALFAMAASLLSAEDLVLNGDHTVTVASGSTETISDKVTGPGRIILLGGGTLVLKGNIRKSDATELIRERIGICSEDQLFRAHVLYCRLKNVVDANASSRGVRVNISVLRFQYGVYMLK